jgi:hypothetical protein
MENPMSIKSLLRGTIVACLLALPLSALGVPTNTPTNVTITEIVDPFLEWDTTNTNTISDTDLGHITDATTAKTFTRSLNIFTNTDVALAPTAGDANGGVLTSGTQTLTTSYKLAGAGVDALTRDAAFVAAATFITQTGYAITHVSGTGTYVVDLSVKADPNGTAPDAATYSCIITITATW